MNNLYNNLKQAIQEEEQDKQNNPVEWIAQFNSHDETNRELIKIGIQNVRHLVVIYFDFDQKNYDFSFSSREEALNFINEKWGGMETFKLIQ